jgi:hypothetical protein
MILQNNNNNNVTQYCALHAQEFLILSLGTSKKYTLPFGPLNAIVRK